MTSSSHGRRSSTVESPQSHRRSSRSFGPVRTVCGTVGTSNCDAVSFRNPHSEPQLVPSKFRSGAEVAPQQQNVADVRCVCERIPVLVPLSPPTGTTGGGGTSQVLVSPSDDGAPRRTRHPKPDLQWLRTAANKETGNSLGSWRPDQRNSGSSRELAQS